MATRRSVGQQKKDSSKETYRFVYSKDQIIAVGPQKKGEEVKIFQVKEDMRTNDARGRIKVVELKKLKTVKQDVVYQEADEQMVAVNTTTAPVTNVEQKKGTRKDAKSQFVFKNEVLENVARQIVEQEKDLKKGGKAQTLPPATKKGLKAESEPEKSAKEEDDDEEEEIPAKKAKGAKKLPAQRPSKNVRTDSEDDAPSSKKKKPVKSKPATLEVPKSKPARQSARGRSREQVNYEESSQMSKSEVSQADLSEQSESAQKGKKKGRAQSSKGRASSTKFKKGAFNPLIQEVVDHNRQLADNQNEMLIHQAVKMNNKEFIRAAWTGNVKLFESILRSKNKVSTFFERWGPERDFNAIEVLFKNGNKTLLQKFLTAISKKEKFQLTSTPACSLKEINTGFNDKFAYGVRTRKVALARGGREGNNALVYDLGNEEEWSQYMFDRLLETETFPVMFNYLQTHIPAHMMNQLQSRVAVAVRSGNYQVAGALIQQMNKKGGMFGFNQTHAQVLTLTDVSQLTPIKRPSAIKKSVGNMIITPVHCASINPNEAFLRVLLDLSNEQSIMDETMRKPVHYAATCIGTGPLKLLLERGVDPREGDREKTTPLMLACRYGRAHNIEVLLKEGGLKDHDINVKNKEGNAAIHHAAQGGHLECLRKLLSAGANIQLPGKNRMTPLIIASAYGHFECVQWLLENGAKILLRDKFRRSALIMAVRNGNVDVTSLLLMKGSEFNGADSSKNSPVHYAAAYGFPECIELLIKAGADQNAKNSWNLTPLSVALQKNLFGVVKVLLNYESTDVNCKDDEGRTLVSSSLSKFTADSFEYIKFLILEKGADVCIADLQGKTPLHYATQLQPSSIQSSYPNWPQMTNQEKEEITGSYMDMVFQLISILIEKGANINVQDNAGQTPFTDALVSGNYQVVSRFMELQRPDLNLVNKQDENILHQMCRQQTFFHSEGLRIFNRIFQSIENKVEQLTAIDANGYTPLLQLVEKYAQGYKSQFFALLSKLENQEFVNKLHELLANKPAEVPGQKKKKAVAKTQPKRAKKAKGRKQLVEEEEEVEDEENGDEDLGLDEENHDDEDQLPQESKSKVHDQDDSDEESDDQQPPQKVAARILAPRKALASQPAQPFGGFSLMAQPSPAGFSQFPAYAATQFGAQVTSAFAFGGVASQFGAVPTNEQYYRTHQFIIKNKAEIVGLSRVEYTKLLERVCDLFSEIEDGIFLLIENFLAEGAVGSATVARIKKFRPGQQRMIEEQNKSKSQIHEEEEEEVDEDEDEDDEEDHSGLRGGARTMQTARKAFGAKAPRIALSDAYGDQPVLPHHRYVGTGKQNILHFMFQHFPSIRNVERILKLIPLDVNARDFRGRTPLHVFSVNSSEGYTVAHEIHHGKQECQMDFLGFVLNQLSADFTLLDKERNTAASHLALRGLFKMLEMITKLGGTTNNLNRKNQVPLIEWVKQNQIEHCRRLLELGASPNFTDRFGRSALHHAVNCSNSSADASFELEQLLIRGGARADLQDKQMRTPLYYAFVKIGNPFNKTEIDPFETVSSLCALPDCSVNVLDRWKRTPLHYAAQRGAVISGRYLIKLKAPVDSFDEDHNTPLALAFINGHSNFATMLIDNQANISELATVVDTEKITAELRQRQAKKASEKTAKRNKLSLVQPGQEDNLESDNDLSVYTSEDESEDLLGGADPVPVQAHYTGGMFGGSGGFFGGPGRQFGQPVAKNASNNAGQITPGQHTFFMLAIKHGWQGVAYLLITDGFDLQQAIQDALNANQFKLVKTLLSKVKDNSLIKKLNADGQNLFHTLAQKGAHANHLEAVQLIAEMFAKGIDSNTVDKFQRTPLHYACKHNFTAMQDELLAKKSCLNQLDSEQQTPFSLGLLEHFNSFAHQNRLSFFISHGLDLNQTFKANKKQTTLLLYLLQEKNLNDETLYNYLVFNGANVNVKDNEGRGVLAHSIIMNSLRLVNFFVSHPQFDKNSHRADNQGCTPIHLVIQPLSFGSYENLQMLSTLVEHGYNVNEKDNSGRTPLDYANLQDSGVMRQGLSKFGAVDTTAPGQRTKRQPTSIVAQADWPSEDVDYEGDSIKYLVQREFEESLRQKKLKDEGEEDEEDIAVQVDKHCHQQGGRLVVVVDPDIGPYSLLMTKVDVKNGHYSENVFYRMQVIHEKNRNVFILFTRWGRIGTPGQFQMTPFESQEVAVKEFNKIFQSKAGNDWRAVQSGETQFEKRKGKYQLMNIGKNLNFKQFLEPFDFSDRSPYPLCTLDLPIKQLMQQITQVKLYFQAIQDLHIDTDFMPLERLSKAQLQKAKSYLIEIQDLIHEVVEQRKKKDFADIDLDEVLRIQEEIAERSSRFYELVPHRDYKSEPVPPIDNEHILNQKMTVVETLLQFEVTSKILLGAHLHKTHTNPLNYCFNAVNIRVMILPHEHPEFGLIQQFIDRSKPHQQGFISNIFAVERRGEAERFDAWKKFGNRQLLWHGSKVSNYMGILSQGLKVAPPWAMNTGAMFGKGIYFADMFEKSWAYTTDYTVSFNPYNGSYYQGQERHFINDDIKDISKYKYMLLCEVALGKPKKLRQAENVEQLPSTFQSVKGMGRRGPNHEQTIVLQNGCSVPVGTVVDYEIKSHDPKMQSQLMHNEYIVYDETQVKVRYLVQLNGEKQ